MPQEAIIGEFTIRIDTAWVKYVQQVAPAELEKQLANTFGRIKNKFFKTWRQTTRLGKDARKRWMRAFKGYINRKPGNLHYLSLRIATWSAAMATHEQGATITAKARRLVVPLPEAQTKTGRTKNRFFTGRGETRRWKGLLKFKNMFVASLPGSSRKVVWERQGNKVVPLFLIVDDVTLIDRLEFFDTWNSLGNYIELHVDRAAERALNNLEKGRAIYG